MEYDATSILDRIRKQAPRRAQVYEHIASEINAGRGFPSEQEIDAHFGWKNGARDHLHCLCADGLLFRLYESSSVRGMRYGLIKEAVMQEPHVRLRAAS